MKKFTLFLMLTLLLFLFNGCQDNKANTIVCNNCGEVVSETSIYCEKCGFKIADVLSEQESSIKEVESSSIEVENTVDNNENIIVVNEDGKYAVDNIVSLNDDFALLKNSHRKRWQ